MKFYINTVPQVLNFKLYCKLLEKVKAELKLQIQKLHGLMEKTAISKENEGRKYIVGKLIMIKIDISFEVT